MLYGCMRKFTVPLSLFLSIGISVTASARAEELPIVNDETSVQPLAVKMANSISDARYSMVSDETAERVILSLQDNAAVLANVTCSSPDSPFLRRIATKGGIAESTLSGLERRVPMEEATAAIAYLIHSAETDDTDHRASLRASPVVIAPALAVAEAVDADGERLLTAIAIGYSVLGALGEPSGPAQTRGLMSSAIYGTVSSAAVAAYLLELDESQTANALSLAASASGGLFQYFYDQTDEKRIIIARAARAGVEAALLARDGAQAAPNVFEGTAGLYPVLLGMNLDRAKVDAIVAKISKLDGPLHVEPKFYSTSDSIIPYLKGIAALDAQTATKLNRIESFELEADSRYGAVLREKIEQYSPPESELSAKLSFNFVLATYLRYGRVTPADFTATRLAEHATLSLAASARFLLVEEESFPVLRLMLDDGEVLAVAPVFPDRAKQVPAYLPQRELKIAQLTSGIWNEDERTAMMADTSALASQPSMAIWVARYQARFCADAFNASPTAN